MYYAIHDSMDIYGVGGNPKSAWENARKNLAEAQVDLEEVRDDLFILPCSEELYRSVGKHGSPAYDVENGVMVLR